MSTMSCESDKKPKDVCRSTVTIRSNKGMTWTSNTKNMHVWKWEWNNILQQCQCWRFEALSSTPGKIHDVQASCLHGWGLAAGSDISSSMYHFDCNHNFTKKLFVTNKKSQTHRPAAGPAALLDEGPAAMILLLIKGMLHKSSLWVLFFKNVFHQLKWWKPVHLSLGPFQQEKPASFESKKRRFPLFFQLQNLAQDAISIMTIGQGPTLLDKLQPAIPNTFWDLKVLEWAHYIRLWQKFLRKAYLFLMKLPKRHSTYSTAV